MSVSYSCLDLSSLPRYYCILGSRGISFVSFFHIFPLSNLFIFLFLLSHRDLAFANYWNLGTFAPSGWYGACPPCPPGFADIDGQPSTACVPCPPGSFSPGNTTVCSLCQPGSADLDSNASTPCASCSLAVNFQMRSNQTKWRFLTRCYLLTFRHG